MIMRAKAVFGLGSASRRADLLAAAPSALQIPQGCYDDSMHLIEERLFLGNQFAAGSNIRWPYPPADTPRQDVSAWATAQPSYAMDRAAAREFLRKRGITHIVCVTAAQSLFSEQGLPGSNGLEPSLRPAIEYCTALFSDKADDGRFLGCLEKLHAFIHSALLASEGNRVLVHCQQGQSRSAAVVVGYLMWARGLSYDAAFERVRSSRQMVLPHMFMFEQSLRGWQVPPLEPSHDDASSSLVGQPSGCSTTVPDDSADVPTTVAAVRKLPTAALRALCLRRGLQAAANLGHDDLVEALLPLSAASQRLLPTSLAANFARASPARIIFLDVDGVLTADDPGLDPATDSTDSAVEVQWPLLAAGEQGQARSSVLEMRALQRLVWLVTAADARIVLSTNWRLSLTLKAELWTALTAAGLAADWIVGETPELPTGRGSEIAKWLEQSASTGSAVLAVDNARPAVRGWVVLDDMSLSGCEAAVRDHAVWVDPERGLLEEHVEQALRILERGA